MAKPVPLASLVSELVSKTLRHRPGPGYRTWAIFQAFDRIGPPVTHYAQPVSFRKGRLSIQVSESVWLTELSMMRTAIMENINGQLPKPWVTEVVLRQGVVRRAPPVIASAPSIPPRVQSWSHAMPDPQLQEAYQKMVAAALAHPPKSRPYAGPPGPRVVEAAAEEETEETLRYGFGDRPTARWTYDRWATKASNKA